MSQPTHVSAGAVLSTGISVTLTAAEEDDGDVRVVVSCNGKEAILVFDEDQVWIETGAPAAWRVKAPGS